SLNDKGEVEILEGFIDFSNNLALEYLGNWSKISDLNTQKIEQKEKYENQIAELELKNEKLETKVKELDDK
ncbi:943_t:CDS:2, partial [Funneliformis geosporum]